VRFSVEQTYLTDTCGKPLEAREGAAYHSLDAETVDAALSLFVSAHEAAVVGDIQYLPGFQAVAVCRQQERVFTMHVLPGTDAFTPARRPSRREADERDESSVR
jgi:hypothetical protein